MIGIGARLKMMRKARQKSQQNLADLAGVSKMAISKYERDMDMPGSDVLLRLAAALETTIESLLRSTSVIFEIKTFRKHPSLSDHAADAIGAQVQEWLERYLMIERMVPDAELSADLPVGDYAVSSWDDIEAAAKNLRKRWQLGTDPIDNLMSLLEDKGIKIGLISGHESFDACTFEVEDCHVIAVKAGIPGDRQRFDLAHELGHLVLNLQDDRDPKIDEEKAAHRFAGAFLVPAEMARRELGSTRTRIDVHELMILKRKYGLSMNAWIYRAKDLGIISSNVAGRLFGYFKKNGWDKEEPGEAYPAEVPLRMDTLVHRALAEEAISRSRAEEFLGRAIPVLA